MASYCQVLLLLLLMVSTEAVQLRPRKRPRTGSLTVTTTPSPSIAHLPNPRRNVLSVFSLPVGQGSAHVIQCPLSPSSNRADLTIFDMGSVSGNRHWKAADVYQYLQNRYSDIKNVIITHENADHYNLLQDAIWSQLGAGQNVNVYVSCSRLGMHDGSTQANLTKNTFNNGDPCGLGTTNANCDASPSPFRLCPDINLNLFQGTILFANGQCSRNQRHNFNSITLRITSTPGQGQASILLSGDQMSDVLAPNLPPTTAYVLTHHGAEYGASDVFANSLRPSVVFASADPLGSYGHPRCRVIDYILRQFGLALPMDSTAQPKYRCCWRKRQCDERVNNQQRAVYTTCDNANEQNVLTFEMKSDGRWRASSTPVRKQ